MRTDLETRIKLYDSTTIDSLPWRSDSNGEYAKAYLVPFIKDTPQYYISNVKTEMMALTIDDLVLPITINQREYENSYVCSPYTHYISYALQELHLIQNKPLRFFLKGTIHALGSILKAGQINKNVIVNNWLLSTNLYPDMTAEQISAITPFLTTRFPKHTIVFRSVNTHVSEDLYQAFEKNKYLLVLSRQVYFLDTSDEKVFKSKPFKQDLKLLSNSGYESIDPSKISTEDIPRIVELYNKLYLNKYSIFNPHFNEKFIELALKTGILSIKALRNTTSNTQIDGVLGYFQRNGVMTTPLFGYDTTISQKTGLYRLISTVLALDAKESKLLLNQSSGASGFKSVRKALPNIEYSAVFFQHLPFYRKIPWILLHGLVNRVILPLMKKYKL